MYEGIGLVLRHLRVHSRLQCRTSVAASAENAMDRMTSDCCMCHDSNKEGLHH
jgi:hypothetical protein